MKKTLGTMVAIMLVTILVGTFITVKRATAGEKARDGSFIAYDNGTVLDTRTKLMWAEDGGTETTVLSKPRHYSPLHCASSIV